MLRDPIADWETRRLLILAGRDSLAIKPKQIGFSFFFSSRFLSGPALFLLSSFKCPLPFRMFRIFSQHVFDYFVVRSFGKNAAIRSDPVEWRRWFIRAALRGHVEARWSHDNKLFEVQRDGRHFVRFAQEQRQVVWHVVLRSRSSVTYIGTRSYFCCWYSPSWGFFFGLARVCSWSKVENFHLYFNREHEIKTEIWLKSMKQFYRSGRDVRARGCMCAHAG